MGNPFVHVELSTGDVDAAKAFYKALLSWELSDREMAPGFTYTLVDVGEGTGGGMMKTPAEGAPVAWTPYVLVDDVVATTAKAKELGAQVCVDVTPVADMGTMAMIRDPTGAMIGFWQPKGK